MSLLTTEQQQAVKFGMCAKFCDHLGIVLHDARSNRVRLVMPWKDELGQMHGLAHAGSLITLGDHCAGILGGIIVGEGKSVLSNSINTNLLRSVPPEVKEIRAEAKILKAGRSIILIDSYVYMHFDDLKNEREKKILPFEPEIPHCSSETEGWVNRSNLAAVVRVSLSVTGKKLINSKL